MRISEHDLMGKTVSVVIADDLLFSMYFNDGSILRITVEAGMGYNEGLAWMKYDITTPNAEEVEP
jgi:hypothetical protein